MKKSGNFKSALNTSNYPKLNLRPLPKLIELMKKFYADKPLVMRQISKILETFVLARTHVIKEKTFR